MLPRQAAEALAQHATTGLQPGGPVTWQPHCPSAEDCIATMILLAGRHLFKPASVVAGIGQHSGLKKQDNQDLQTCPIVAQPKLC